MDLKYVTLEDGKDYIVISEVKMAQAKYLYLVNENDSKDFCIRKVIIENDTKYLSTLDDDAEFNYALGLFNKN